MERQHREVAQVQWTEAGKVRQEILRKISDLKNGRGAINYTSRLDEIENLMKEFRLACMQVTFHDFEYAAEMDVEASLWQGHTILNGEYRSTLSRLGAQNQVVQKRKVDKLYRDFLKTSGFFYTGYIQRLAGLFHIPELVLVAKGLGIDTAQIAPRERSPSSELRIVIVNACYTTMVRLGDLHRYRSNASEKLSETNFRTAAASYNLASMLDPNDGSCHHQMGVLYQMKAQQLEIIYYFHRSICVRKPYKLGPTNLGRAFKSLESHSTGRHGQPKTPSETMIVWFLRLHALYYQGEVFSSQTELEKEVLHRMDLFVKTQGNENVLLRMLVISIAAYDLAIEKVRSNWTLNGSRACQNLLAFNIRTILVLVRHLKMILKDTADARPHEDLSLPRAETTDLYAPLKKPLAFFRIYVAWLYVVRADLAQYQEYLEPHISEVYRLLTDIMNLLLVFVGENQDVVTSQYLLPEDTECVGLRPLSDRKLPLFLNTEIVRETSPPKSRKKLKARREALGSEFSSEMECVWRIRDIVCCGIYLAGSGKVPVAMSRAKSGTEFWYFVDDTMQATTCDESAMLSAQAKLKLNLETTYTDDDAIPGSPTSLADRVPERDETGPMPDCVSTHEHKSSLEQIQMSLDRSSAAPPTANPQSLEKDLGVGSDMAKMVDDLVGLDDEQLDLSPAGRTHYGKDSSTANSVFGEAGSASSPQLSGHANKAITKLPWLSFSNSINAAGTDLDGARVGGGTGLPAPYISPTRTAFEHAASIYARPAAEHPSGTSSPFEAPGSRAASATAVRQAFQGAHDSSDFSAAQRSSALDNLSAQLRAQYGLSSANSPALGGSRLNPQSPDFTSRITHPVPASRGHSRAASGNSAQSPHDDSIASSTSLRNGKNRSRGRHLGFYEDRQEATMGMRNEVGLASDGKGLATTSRHAGAFGASNGADGAVAGHQRPAPLGSPFTPTNAPYQGPAAREQSPIEYVTAPASSSLFMFTNPGSIWEGTPARLGVGPGPWNGASGLGGNWGHDAAAFGGSGQSGSHAEARSLLSTNSAEIWGAENEKLRPK